MSQYAVLFDLDGTLLDTIDDLKNAMNHVLAAHDLAEHDTKSYKQFIGEGLRVLAERAVPVKEHELLDSVVNHFMEYYEVHCSDMTRPYEGIGQMLDQLLEENIPLAVLSNKPHHATKQVIESYFPDVPFKVVSGQKEDVPRKPDAAGAIDIAERLHLRADQCYFVGDTSTDMQTAVNAGMIAVGVTWGFREREELLAAGAKYLIDAPCELFGLLK